jgi:hypothetical protein
MRKIRQACLRKSSRSHGGASCGTGRSPSGLDLAANLSLPCFPVPLTLYTSIEALHEYLNIVLDEIIINKKFAGCGLADYRHELNQAAKIGFVCSGIEATKFP